jgi:hypothetical protein
MFAGEFAALIRYDATYTFRFLYFPEKWISSVTGSDKLGEVEEEAKAVKFEVRT